MIQVIKQSNEIEEYTEDELNTIALNFIYLAPCEHLQRIGKLMLGYCNRSDLKRIQKNLTAEFAEYLSK